MTGIVVDLAALDAIVDRFTAGITDLGDAGRAAPTATPAGLGGAATAAIVAHLLRSSGHLCSGLVDATGGVMQSREDYVAVDERVAARSTGMMEPR